VAVLLVASVTRPERDFRLSPSHFVERNGLLLIVALGESIVAVGLATAGLPVDATLAVAAVLALFLAASVWWTYFGRDDRRAEHEFGRATPAERGRMALLGFGYAHFVMIFGIVLIAAGLEVGIAYPTGPPETVGIWNLAAGLAVYLVGDAAYRRVLRIGPSRRHLLTAGLALLTVPLGLRFGTLAQMAACVLLLQPLGLGGRERSGWPG